ncbi:glycosyltransferase family 2 protein [Candidatus Saccharibacteria bacterium]|nr:glycosyltransferase family 2 protein [Candidatus Saccharibacteria bacterium]NCU40711.1 glycosyltransferase family 2 protein [Candidatus Saccharibacteria bacterium]
MKTPKVAIVVLNFKGWQDTLVCIESLRKQSYSAYHIVLIENGSHDGSAKKLAKLKGSDLTYIEESVNHGFTGGVNIGIQWAIDHDYDAVALFNNDAKATPDWLENLVKAQQKTGTSIVTGLLLSEDNSRIDDAGDLYSTWGLPMLRAENLSPSKAPESGFIFGATGGATLYTIDLFKEIGLFDNTFFAYNEDVDISWRAQLTGHTVYYEKSAVGFHKHSATSKKIPGFTAMQVCKNLPIVLIKNVPFPMIIPMGIKFFFIYWAFVFHKIIHGAAGPALKGVWKSLTLWPHALRERRRIQKTKTVSNQYIRSILHKGMPLRSIRRMQHFIRHPFSRGTEFDY